jgi:primosomal protein N' (replication factor Y) (superfamily II helicase)
MAVFAQVVLPLAIPKTYTYAVPNNLVSEVSPGKRVLVQFGKKRLYSGLIAEIHQDQPAYKAKPIIEVLDDDAIVLQEQLEFWGWISKYYMCTLGEVLNAALPSGFKLASETIITANSNQQFDWNELSDEAFLIMEALEKQPRLTIREVMDILDLKQPGKVLKSMEDAGWINLSESVKQEAKPRTVKAVNLAAQYSEDSLPALFEELKRAPKQSATLLGYLRASRELKDPWVPYQKLTDDPRLDGSAVRALVEKGILIFEERDPFLVALSTPGNPESSLQPLSDRQKVVLTSIQSAHQKELPCLLYGVTGSGKTEVYAHLIREKLQEGKRVLYLLPEIALTTQLIQRLRRYFGEEVGVYHSRVNEKDRMRLWQNLATDAPGTPHLIVGARSALLLPLPKLGLIVVDEEHETSFKQFDPAPRYHARDAAMWLAHHLKTGLILGSATPSLESWHLANEGKIHLESLEERYGGVQLPEIEVVNIKSKGEQAPVGNLFSPRFLEETQKVLENDQRMIIFQNRRGFSSHIQCRDCGHTFMCGNCDISLTYHKYKNKLQCHYCGFSIPQQVRCSACGSKHLKLGGFGTERLEEDLQLVFPEARIGRMDLDSTRRKDAVEDLLTDFEAGKINILVGTQMVTKGLDFDKVALVVIIQADNLLYFPDFRAHERAFQLMAQVSGRAGRRAERGKVLIQTYSPEHEVIRQVRQHNFLEMAKTQLFERKEFAYPPYYRLIQITLLCKDRTVLKEGADLFGIRLKSEFGNRILGPEFPVAERLKGFYRMQLLIKIERATNPVPIKTRIQQHADAIFLHKPYTSVRLVYDVDPA